MHQALKVCRPSTKKLAETQQETAKDCDKETKLPPKLVTPILQISFDMTDTRNDESNGVALDYNAA